MINSVVFDMGRVLIHWSGELLMQHYTLTAQDREDITRELFSSVEWVQLDRGSITEEQALASICPRLPEHLHSTARELVTAWWQKPLHPIEGMEELIRELKAAGYGIYVLSNAGLPLRQYCTRLPGADCFDGVLVSAEEKLLKPQPELFRLLNSRFGLTLSQCVFIDDLPANVEGAVNVGMHGCIFRGDAKDLRRQLRAKGIRCKCE